MGSRMTAPNGLVLMVVEVDRRSVKVGHRSRLILVGVSTMVIYGALTGPHLVVKRPDIKEKEIGDGISAATKETAMLHRPP